jgi:ribosome modulation factor
MMLMHITQGEGKFEVDLGPAWFCVKNDTALPDYCDECEEYRDPQKDVIENLQHPDKGFLLASRTDEFQEGQAACFAGVVASKNPYRDEERRTAWLAGWNYVALSRLSERLRRPKETQLEIWKG